MTEPRCPAPSLPLTGKAQNGEERLRLHGPVDASEPLTHWLPIIRGWSAEGTVEEVGSTGVPGLPTKGDLDLVVVEESPRKFGETRELLRAHLDAHEPEHWTSTWASFAGNHAEAGQVGVQLVILDSDEDKVLRGFRALLLSDVRVVENYAALKRAYAGKSMRQYRAAKARFVESLIDL